MWLREPISEPLVQEMGWEWTGEIGEKCMQISSKVPSLVLWHFGTFGSDVPPASNVEEQQKWNYPREGQCPTEACPGCTANWSKLRMVSRDLTLNTHGIKWNLNSGLNSSYHRCAWNNRNSVSLERWTTAIRRPWQQKHRPRAFTPNDFDFHSFSLIGEILTRHEGVPTIRWWTADRGRTTTGRRWWTRTRWHLRGPSSDPNLCTFVGWVVWLPIQLLCPLCCFEMNF